MMVATFGGYDFLVTLHLVFDLAALPEIPQSWQLYFLPPFPLVFDLAALPEIAQSWNLACSHFFVATTSFHSSYSV